MRVNHLAQYTAANIRRSKIEIIISITIVVHSINIWGNQQGQGDPNSPLGLPCPFLSTLSFILSFNSNNNSGGENNIPDNNNSES